jgi:hypothetical protein
MPARRWPRTAASRKANKPRMPTAAVAASPSTACSGAVSAIRASARSPSAANSLCSSTRWRSTIRRRCPMRFPSSAIPDSTAARAARRRRAGTTRRNMPINGPLRVIGMYSNGGQDTGHARQILRRRFGVTYPGTVGRRGLREREGRRQSCAAPSTMADESVPTPGLAAYISNDTSYNLMGKYVFEFGDSARRTSSRCMRATPISRRRMGLHRRQRAGQYPISVGINVNDSAEYNMEWVGARYAMSSGWNFVGAFYHVTQNSWTIGLGTNGTDNSAAPRRACSAPVTSRKHRAWWTTSSTSTTTCMAV